MVLAPAVAARDVLLLLAAVAAFYSASGAVAVAPSERWSLQAGPAEQVRTRLGIEKIKM